MDWQTLLSERAQARSSHAFLLHMNVADVFLTDGNFSSLIGALDSSAPIVDADVVVSWNRGNGFTFPNAEHRELFKGLLNSGTNTANLFEVAMDNQRDVGIVLPIFDRFLNIEYTDELLETLDRKDAPRVVLLLEHVETLVPPNSAASSQQNDRMGLVLLQQWSRSAGIRQNGHSIILVAPTLEAVDSALIDPTSGITPIMVDLPDTRSRLKIIERADVVLGEEMSAANLAHLTAGLPTRSIVEILTLAEHREIALTPDSVFETKKKLIEEQSGGTLEIMRPKWPLEVIGGLSDHKDFLREIADALKRQDPLGCPQGVMLMGPPGTGKTIIAEVLASVANIPLIKLNDVRSMWVGESERNMTLALHIIERMAPVIVFMDELDQQVQQRGNTFNGDSGVSSRISAKLFEFMSDTALRGRVVWLGATNRPGDIDPAMLREGRFDDKLPFCPPNAEERARIFPALLGKMKLHAARYDKVFAWDISEDQFAELGERTMLIIQGNKTLEWYQPGMKVPKDPMDRVDMTGGEIEALLGAAYRHRADTKKSVLHFEDIITELEQFLLSRDISAYQEMTKQALRYSGSLRFIPEEWQKHAKQIRTQGSQISVSSTGGDEGGQYL